MKFNLFPNQKPYKESYLKVSKLHTLHFEEVGNPKGHPVIFLHGGPGVGIIPEYRRFFDPKFYRIILLDQRGAGKSTPFAELKENNTPNLIKDLETLRKQLKIEKWIVSGGSWGSTLALAYAIKHPSSVKAMIIRGVFLAEKEEIDWLFSPEGGAAKIWPDKYHEFTSILKNKSLVLKEYHSLLNSKSKIEQKKAAENFSKWESTIMTLVPENKKIKSLSNPKRELSFAKTEVYYSLKNFFMPEKYIIKNINKIKDLPLKIVQGRYDIICPMSSAYKLHKAHPKSELIIVPTGSHSPLEPQMASELIRAQENFKKLYR